MSSTNTSIGMWALAVGTAFLLLLCPGAETSAFAQVSGENVVSGEANFSRDGNQTVIQASNNAIIEYGSFNVGRPETVQFIQPSDTARVLNRIVGPGASIIDGTILANGHVYFANPAGIFFGGSAVVDVAGLHAAAGNITNQDFLNNIDRYFDVQGSVINDGLISADAVHLIGQNVSNRGSIFSDGGLVVMTAGDDVLIGERDGHLRVVVSGGQGATGVENSGTIEADGGQVLFGAGDLYSTAIHQTGTVRANDIQLQGGLEGIVSVSGTLDASSSDLGALGGRVQILGNKIALLGATIDASGDAGGGVVLVGGDLYGRGALRNADAVFVDSNSSIFADAYTMGDGGQVVLWADGVTRAYGHISATGGAEGGDGGFVETSGKRFLDVVNAPDLSAPAGHGGTWLLDPEDVLIQAATGTLDGLTPNFTANQATSTVSATVINEALDSGTSVIISTDRPAGSDFGHITQDASAAIVKSAGGDATITFNAAGNITLNGGISSTAGELNVVLVANDAAQSAHDLNLAAGNVDINAGITTNGGDFTSSGVLFDNTGGAINLGAGNFTINHTGNAPLAAAITAGNVDIDVNGNVLLSQRIDASGTVSIDHDGSGTISGAGEIVAGGAVTFGATRTGALTLGGDVTTTDDDITFTRGVTLSSDVVIDTTGLTAGDILFSSTLALGGREAQIDAGAVGNITFGGAISGGGDLNLVDGNAISFADLNVGTLTVQDATTSVTFGGTVDATGAIDLDSGGTIAFNGGAVTAGSTMNVDSTGTTTVGATSDISAQGAVTFGGTLGGGLDLAGDITSSDSDVTFNNAVTATGNVVIDTTGAAAGNLLFGSTLATGGNTVTLDSGPAGNLTVTGAITGGGDLVVRDGANQFYGAITVDNLTIQDATTATTFGGTITTTNDVSVTSGAAVSMPTLSVGGNLDITAGGAISQSAAWNVTGTSSFATNTDDTAITLSNSGNVFAGAVSFNTQTSGSDAGHVVLDNGVTAIDLAASTIAGDFTATSGGAITQSGAISVSGDASFTTDVADRSITINDAGNSFSGSVLFTTSGGLADVNLDAGTSAVDLGSSTIGGDLTVTAGGNMTQSGALTVGGNASFTTDVSNSTITLNSSNAITGTVAFSTVGTTAHVQFDNGTSALDLAASSVSGNLSVTSGEVITQSGALTVSGMASFTTDVANKTITLGDTANAISGGVSFMTLGTTGDVVFDSGTTGLDLDTSSIGGDIAVTSGAGITQSGPLTVAGTASFTSDVNGMDITLDDAANAISGIVTFVNQAAANDANVDLANSVATTLAATTINGDLTLDVASTLALPALTVGDALNVTAGGAVTQSGALTVAGTSSLATDVADQAITLDDTANAMTGAISFSTVGTAGNVTVDNGTTNLILGTSAVNGTLAATSGGTITQTGGLTVSGDATFTTDVDDMDITLTNGANALAGAVTFVNQSPGDLADVDFNNGVATSLGNATINGNLTVDVDDSLSFAAITVDGNLDATSGGAMGQSAALTVGGTSTFATDVADQAITLNNPSNALTGAIGFSTLGTSGDVTFDNGTTATSLGASTVNGALSVTAGEAITDSGVLAVSGAATFTTDVADKTIVLDAGHALAGTVGFNTSGTVGDVTLDNGANAVDMGTSSISGDLAVTSGDVITDSGAMTVSGAATFTTDVADRAITLDFGHAVTGAVTFSTLGTSGHATFDNGTTALDLGASTVNGDLAVTAGEAINDSGILTVSGTSSFATDVADKAITLDQANAMTGAVSFSTLGTNGNVSVDNGATNLVLGTSSVLGTFAATSGGSITQTGGLTVSGTAAFTTDVDDMDITLSDAGNAISGAVTFTNQGAGNLSDVVFANSAATTLASTTINGDLTLDVADTLVLPTLTVNGDLQATSGGAMTQSGALTVLGAGSFATDVSDIDITLSNNSNAITGTVDFSTLGTGGDITFDNGATALVLGASTVNGALTVTSGEVITDAGALTVTGPASFTTDAADKTITLDAGHAMTGPVSFTTAGTVGHVELDNGTTALELGASTINGNLQVTSGEAISDSGALTVSGTASFTTDVADKGITLDAGHVISGAVSFATLGTTGDVSFDNGTTAIDLGASTVNGDLTIISGETIGDSGALTVSGATSFTTDVANKAITLDEAHAMSGAVSFTTSGGSGDVSVDNGTTALVLAASNVDGTFAATSGGGITQSGGLTISGTASFTSDVDDMDITLTNAANAISGAVTFVNQGAGNLSDVNFMNSVATTLAATTVNGDLTVDSDAGLVFPAMTVNGDLVATAGDNITQSGALTVSGSADFTTDVVDKTITINDTSNAVTGAVSFSTMGTSGDVNFDNGATALVLGASSINGALTVVSGEAISDAGTISVSGAASFTTDVADKAITLDAGHAFSSTLTFTTAGTSGDVTLDNGTTAVDLGASTINGNLDVTSGETIDDSGVLTVSGTASFTTDVADKAVTLDVGHAVSGAVSFSTLGSSGDVTFDNDTTALNLGLSNVGGALTVTSGDVITDSGVLTVGGASSFTTDVTDKAITLDEANALSGTVAFTTVGTSGDVSVDNGTTNLDFAASTINGTLAATTGGDITQTGALTVSGAAAFTTDVDDSDITLTNAGNAIGGAITFTNQSPTDVSDVSLTNTGGTTLATGTINGDLTIDVDGAFAFPILTVDGDLAITAGGAITQGGAITVGGAASFTTDVDDMAVTLSNTGNGVTGDVSFTTQGTTADVVFDNGTTALSLGASNVAGDLTITAGEAISDTGSIIVSGAGSFTTDVADKAITLDQEHGVSGSVTFSTAGTAAHVTFDNGTTALDLAASTINGNLTITSGEAISDSGVLTVSGTATFATDVADKAISLDAGHAVTGAVDFTTSGTLGHVTFDNGTTALDLGASTVNGILTITAGEAIVDSGVLTVSGTASFTTDVADKAITLDAGHALGGAVSFTTSGTSGHVTLDNGTSATNLSTSTVGGNLSVTAGEAITDSGNLTVSGTASFATDVADKAITLDATNDITGAVDFTTSGSLGHVTFDNGTTAMNLGASNVGGDLAVTAGEAITDSGALTVSGTSSFTTDVVDKAITLDETNAMTGAVTFTTAGTNGDVSVDNGTTNLVLAASTVNGTFAATTGGTITQTGALTISGTAAFTTDVDDMDITL
ncbi:MAG: filamentous hemagglutinin N-terminal domain-containing protein, partial [Planctomycetota bacterium]